MREIADAMNIVQRFKLKKAEDTEAENKNLW